MPDLFPFFQDIVGTPTLLSIFGPSIFRVYPTFAEDIFHYDKLFPRYATGLPRSIMRKEYAFRDRLVKRIMDWYAYARENFDVSESDGDGDGDPVWGSALMKHRQDTILKVDNHDDEALARLDLGLAWA